VPLKRLGLAILVTLPVALLAQSDATTWVVWTRQNHFPVLSVVATPNDDYSDLQFLKPIIGSRRLVQLGESGHGVAEFDAAKVRLIKFFHEQMGFDVMAFESSIYECVAAGTATGSVDMLAESIFTVWATEEVVPLFEYILTTQRTGRPLILAGFDTQTRSARGLAQRPAFLRRIVAAVDVGYADEVAAFDTDFVLRSRRDPSKYDASEAFYDRLDTFFKDNRDRLAQAFPGDPRPIIAERTAYSMVQFMGSFIAERFRTELYTIGLYMNQGLAALNDRSIYAIRPAPNGSMEWVMASAGPSALFVDFLHESLESGNEWMFQPVETREWGVSSLALVPRDQYDGVLFVDRVNPPKYLRF
jgi:erythromycin esterase-like protein